MAVQSLPQLNRRRFTAPGTLPAGRPADTSAAEVNITRNVTFYMGLITMFIKFGMLQEIQTYVMGFRGYVLYVFGVPALLGVLLGGGVKRTLSTRAIYWWVGFSIWMVICIPFSSWKGGSALQVKNFILFQLSFAFVLAGLVVNWREFQLLTKSIAVAAVLNVLVSRIFVATNEEGRINLDFGMVSDPNDYSAHLLLTVPFLLLTVHRSKSIVLRLIAAAFSVYAVVVIFRTGSRGGLVAIIAVILFVFLVGSGRQRLILACGIPLVLLIISVAVPATVLKRIRSFSSTQDDALAEAVESAESRQYLMRKAVQYSLEFPLFGVGPGQFLNYEGQHSLIFGTHGSYHQPHNTFLQAFAEMGMPGGIMHLCAYIATFLLLRRVHREAKRRPHCRDIEITCFYVRMSMVGFTVAIIFLNFTYLFYGPVLTGMATALWLSSKTEFARRDAALTQAAQ